MVKQPACAAAKSSSGLVPLPCSNRLWNEYGVLTSVPLADVIRMATLTPARIIGQDHEIGSIAPGKRADLLVLDSTLQVKQVFLAGESLRNLGAQNVPVTLSKPVHRGPDGSFTHA